MNKDSQLIFEAYNLLTEGENEHPELKAFKSNLFSVNTLKTNLADNIGKWVKFKSVTPESGLICHLPFKIMHLQKNYKGDIIYRGENQVDTFGRPINPNEVDIIDENQAKQIWYTVQQKEPINGMSLTYGEEFNPNFGK